MGAVKRKSVVIQALFLVLTHASLGKAQFCNTEVLKDNGQMFRSMATGETRHCGSEFVYELVEHQRGCGVCGILKLGYAMAEPCHSDVEITFNTRVADMFDRTWIQSGYVSVRSGIPDSVDGYVGVFNGVTSFIEIPLFQYSELGARVQITIRYKEDSDLSPENSDMGLVSNSDSADVLPTLAIVHSMRLDSALAALNTTGGIFKQLNVPIPLEKRYQWKTVTFEYDARSAASRAQLILEDPRRISRDSIIGNIQPRQTPLVIGKGAFVGNFKGQIDHVRISRCSPVQHTSIP